MRLAIISDIHGNEIALEAVLRDIRHGGADGIVCLGDVATLGPSPGACLEMLMGAGCQCVMGNHDEFLLSPELMGSYIKLPVMADTIAWARGMLTGEQADFLRTFRRSVEVPLEGGAILCVHGSPRSHMDDVLATTPPEELESLFAGFGAPLVACGHTHIQMMRQHRGRLFINPGSVGFPFREHGIGQVPVILHHAEYALVESSGGGVAVDLRRLPIDRGAVYRAAEACDSPFRGFLMHVYS
ncbi:MAG: metallophosphoesterase family protein [Spirochaetes bacterium]|nr:metallophosphoesterase family protein [Spirochaetota bacterium]